MYLIDGYVHIERFRWKVLNTFKRYVTTTKHPSLMLKENYIEPGYEQFSHFLCFSERLVISPVSSKN